MVFISIRATWSFTLYTFYTVDSMGLVKRLNKSLDSMLYLAVTVLMQMSVISGDIKITTRMKTDSTRSEQTGGEINQCFKSHA